MNLSASGQTSNHMRRLPPGLHVRLWRRLRLGWLWFLSVGLGIYTLWEIMAQLSRSPIRWPTLVGWLAFGLSLLLAAVVRYLNRPPVKIILPEDQARLTFADYWGQPAVVRHAQQWAACLIAHRQFTQMGGQIDGGLVLYGQPGSGRTRLARAIAGEAEAPFIALAAAEFRSHPGRADSRRISRFCELARRLAQVYGTCIAYVDDLETVAANDYAAARLGFELDNQTTASFIEHLLAAMAHLVGRPYRRRWHVLYVAAATHADGVAPALLRPGRFDQHIDIPLPDRAGRRAIIQNYLQLVEHDADVNIEAIVEDTSHATPAMLANILTRNAVRIALAHGRKQVTQQDIDAALQETLGLERPFADWDPRQRRQVAYHEAGHAVAQHYLLPDQRIVRVTIIPRSSGLLGHVHYVDRVEMHSEPLHRVAAKIMVSMAGHTAVKLHTGEYWDGAWSDFRNIRRNIWILYSLGYFGPPVRGFENGGPSVPENAAPLIERFWKTLEEQVENLLRQHAGEVEAIAQALLEKEELSQDAVLALLGNNRPPTSAVQSSSCLPPPPPDKQSEADDLDSAPAAR